MEYFYATKKNEIWPFAAIWMDLKYKMLYDMSCMLNLKYNANESVHKRNRLTNITKQTYGYQSTQGV